MFVADGATTEIFRVSPGPNGIFDGAPPTGDDQVSHFDTGCYGQPDPEGINYNQDTNRLYIVSNSGGQQKVLETTPDGTVIGQIDIGFLNARAIGGVASRTVSGLPPNPPQINLYIAARGVDNDQDPNENDGKVYEITLREDPIINLLANPSYENDANNDGKPDSWSTSSQFTRSNQVVLHGTYAGKHQATDNSTYTISQTVNNLVAGQAYTLSSGVHIPPTSDTFSFKLQVRWRNAANATISTPTIKTYTTGTSGWDQATARMIAPAGTTNAQVRMSVSSLNATVYVDNFIFGQ